MTAYAVRRILVPVDFSDSSREALRFAHSLAGTLGASIEVLHVINPTDTLLHRAADPSASDPESARSVLREFVAQSGSDSVPVTTRVEEGAPYDRIVAVARDEGFDLIVMGTHGRTGRAQSLVGSVAETVVRTSPQPVLTVRGA